MCTVNELILLLDLLKVIEFKFVNEVCIIKSTEICLSSLLKPNNICAQAMPREPKKVRKRFQLADDRTLSL